MIPFNNKFGKNETPVTDLSKRLYMTHVNDKRSNEPVIYMDESANQEPPSFDIYSNVIYPSFGDDQNSCSSGYYSNSSASAPSTCNLNYTTKQDKLILDNIKTIADPFHYKNSTTSSSNIIENGDSKTQYPQDSIYKNVKLRRCHSTSWLSKRRTRRETVPVISRIVRRTSLNQNLKKDLFPEEDIEKTQIISTLLTVHEKPEPNTGNSTMEIKVSNSSTILSPGKAKRARLSSISNSDMDSTQILSSNVLQTIGNINTEWSRHHSTPTSRFKKVHQQDPAISPLSSRNFSKPILSRFHSVPVPHVSSDAQIGDMLPASLPVVDKTSSGLNCISAKTLNDLIEGRFAHKNIKYTIVDCRYPYEYEGGHIRGAKNFYTQDRVLYNVFTQIPAKDPNGNSTGTSYFSLADELNVKLNLDDVQSQDDCPPPNCQEESLLCPIDENSTCFEITSADELHQDILQASMDHSRTRHSSKSDFMNLLSLSACSDNGEKSGNLDQPSQPSIPVIIFHCEFSSQRAPSLATFLRSIDRTSNFHRYPFLYFPEIYILKGGYSEFFKSFPNQCTPRMYRTMFDRSYQNELMFEKRLTKGITEACMSLLRSYKDLKASMPPNNIPQLSVIRNESRKSENRAPKIKRTQTMHENNRIVNLFYDSSEDSSESDSSGKRRDLEFKRMLFGGDDSLTCEDPIHNQNNRLDEKTNDLCLVHQVIRTAKSLANQLRQKFVHPKIIDTNEENEDKENTSFASPIIASKQISLFPTPSDMFKSFEMAGTPNQACLQSSFQFRYNNSNQN